MTGSTFLGMKVYKTNFLKVYFPFMLSGSTMFFAMSYVHTKLMDGKKKLLGQLSKYHNDWITDAVLMILDPNDKWARNV